ncbi:virion core protein, T7 gp14 family [Sinorhizobium terangae]|uniref:virion core protein, T7 gp14 family n=1 Tax=Sinorhizobium terangae TaxID=110322 RepID=UPI0024B0EE93|nr:hypothetical protein [Sinorhizobium terangae]WFU49030.1 hypothetical protein QA637_06400 [Sinorhizobium terangae]
MIGLAIGGLTQAASYQAETAAAAQQNAYYRQNAANANQAARDEQFATQKRMIQEQEAAAAEKIDIMKEHRAAKATAEVAAGEAGVSGVSVDALMRDIMGQQSQAIDRTDQQTEWSLNQLNDEMRAIRTRNTDRINSVQRAAKPSFVSTGLAIGSTALDSYSGAVDRRLKLGEGWWKKP